jgi:beclin 1
LRNTNFINEVFYISTLDEFGTISGFRMGRLPTTDVKWEEINAAIGQSLYLLCVLAHRFNYKIEKYDISLGGAYSRISQKNTKTKYELYMPQNEERFNSGLVLVLDALNALCLYVC